MSELRKCPCGETPGELHINDTLSGKWIDIMGDCCGEWSIEERNNYATGDERVKNAIRAWNDAPRGDL